MKLHQRLFQILVVFLPTQLAFHFWPDWAFIYGIKVNYFSPTIYLTDLLLISVVVTWILELRRKGSKSSSQEGLGGRKFKNKFILVVFIASFVVVNVLSAKLWQVALLNWLKVFEMFLLALYVKYNWRRLKRQIVIPLTIALSYSTLIALWQFFIQKTIGGAFYYLGERTFSVSTPGIALVDILGNSFMRSYATFPHPNVLAGFTLVTLLFLTRKLVIKMGAIVLLVSFSQAVWVAGLLIFVLGRVRGILSKRVVVKSLLLLFILSLAFSILSKEKLLNVFPENESVRRRVELAAGSLDVFSKAPLMGVGLGNFISELTTVDTTSPGTTWVLQPVHNIYLLLLAETGVVGFILFFWLLNAALLKVITKKDIQLTLALLVILMTGMVDHYWLTLQQTQLLLALVIGASFSRIEL